VWDQLDTAAREQTIIATTTWSRSNPNSATIGNYTITYNAVDDATLSAEEQIRTVMVMDTTPPTATIVGEQLVVVPSAQADVAFAEDRDDGAKCHDDCDVSLDTQVPVRTWDRAWDEMTMGRYTRTYTCTDGSGHKHNDTRVFELVDTRKPVIYVKGQRDATIEASVTEEYTDAGAECHDIIDKDLSHAVEVSGAVVNRRVPGKYEIKYDCLDISNNAAPQETRTVTVKDGSCPHITMLGQKIMYVEAGYPWVDPGATATDDLDGDITDHIVTDGDQVNTAKAFYSRRSCREIKEAWGGAQSGEYYISTQVGATWQRVLVHCDMSGAKGVTFFTCDGCKAVKPYGTVPGDCTSYGLEMIDWSWAGYITAKNDAANTLYTTIHGERYFIPSPPGGLTSGYTADGMTDMYLCGINDSGTDRKYKDHTNNHEIEQLFGQNMEKVTHAEQGKYIISYKVSDSSNNVQCSSPKRTVIVRDTLPPVLTLHLKGVHGGQPIQTSQYNQHGITALGHYDYSLTPTEPDTGLAENPPQWPREDNNDGTDTTPSNADFDANTNAMWADSSALMAVHNSGVSAWLIGAIASATAGVALLVIGSRKASTISVPV